MKKAVKDRVLNWVVGLVSVVAFGSTAGAEEGNAARMLGGMQWEADKTPFSFTYKAAASAALLGKWEHTVTEQAGEEFTVYQHRYADPESGLRVTAEVKQYSQLPAVEWVLYFSNEGDQNTGIIEDVFPLQAQLPAAAFHTYTLHYAKGDEFSPESYAPQCKVFSTMNSIGNVQFQSSRGRSSDAYLPFFNMQIDSHGVIGALGWTGDWQMDIGRNGNAVKLVGGMKKTRFFLYPQEKVRTPRILLMEWQGELEESYNTWRRFLLRHYSPLEADQTHLKMPVCYLNWGEVSCQEQIRRAQEAIDKGFEYEVFWIDAGWYGSAQVKENSTVFDGVWGTQSGNWWPNQGLFPEGMKPLSDFLKQHNKELLIWFQPEIASGGSELAQKHPDWLLGGGLVNLGNPEALQGIIDMVAGQMIETGATWYRQDFNMDPAWAWQAADQPDRTGITEMKHIEGLYTFWDELKKRVPGLKIDNCSSGGRRIDLEMISRSAVLWRTDYPFEVKDLCDLQSHMFGLSYWVPLQQTSLGVSDRDLFRGAMGAGMTLSNWDGKMVIDGFIPQVREYQEIRDYFYGDYYPLIPYSPGKDSWTAWQFHNRDKNAGVAVFVRKPESNIMTLQANLRKINREKRYEVKLTIRSEPPSVTKIPGEELAGLAIELKEKRDSAVLVYKMIME